MAAVGADVIPATVAAGPATPLPEAPARLGFFLGGPLAFFAAAFAAAALASSAVSTPSAAFSAQPARLACSERFVTTRWYEPNHALIRCAYLPWNCFMSSSPGSCSFILMSAAAAPFPLTLFMIFPAPS